MYHCKTTSNAKMKWRTIVKSLSQQSKWTYYLSNLEPIWKTTQFNWNRSVHRFRRKSASPTKFYPCMDRLWSEPFCYSLSFNLLPVGPNNFGWPLPPPIRFLPLVLFLLEKTARAIPPQATNPSAPLHQNQITTS